MRRGFKPINDLKRSNAATSGSIHQDFIVHFEQQKKQFLVSGWVPLPFPWSAHPSPSLLSPPHKTHNRRIDRCAHLGKRGGFVRGWFPQLDFAVSYVVVATAAAAAAVARRGRRESGAVTAVKVDQPALWDLFLSVAATKASFIVSSI